VTAPPLLDAAGLDKTYPGVRALRGANFSVGAGEVAGLVGKNGAGKSTLIKVIAGTETPDAGRVEFDGTDITGASVRAIGGRGIITVPQEMSLWNALTVGENLVFPDLYDKSLGVIRWRRVRQRAEAALERVGCTVSPSLRVSQASISDRRSIMIARALMRNPRLLILDEPTEAFTENEVGRLLDIVRALASDGISVVYVSHRLGEVCAVSDHVTVMRDGRAVQRVGREELDRRELVSSIVGLPSGETEEAPRTASRIRESAKPVLTVKGLSTEQCEGVDLTVREGEIVGVYGLPGSGREEMLQGIAGGRRHRTTTLSLGGRDIRGMGLRRRRNAGLVYLGGDRARQGLFLTLSIRENVSIAMRTNAWIPRLDLRSIERKSVHGALQDVGADVVDIERKAATLSGGNQQKLLVARGILRQGHVWLLDEPTVGLDVGARRDLFAMLRRIVDGEYGESGGALVVLSDYDDLRASADRVLVMRRGRIVDSVTREGLSESGLLHAASFAE
jgi:ribose transport system ATP-binding protein